MILSLIVATVAFCLVVLAGFWWSTRSAVAGRVRSRVVVTLKSGDAFDGVLYEADRTAWILRNALAVGLGENGTNAPVDGEVLVLTADIAFAQKP